MDELLAAAAEALDAPAEMVERSAAARAKADGVPIEDVLSAWAGGETVPSAAPAEPAPSEEPTPAPTASAPTAEAPPPEPGGPMNEAAMIKAAAHRMNMPESMVKRSLAARAKVSGRSEGEILAEWAGASGDTVPPPGASTELPPPSEPTAPEAADAAETPEAAEVETEATAGPAPAEPAAAPAAGMDEGALLAAAAEEMGMPESMVKRSAGARAKAQGVSVTAVLAEWAGVEVGDAPSAEASAASPAVEDAAPREPSADAQPGETEIAEDGPDVEVLGSSEDVEPRAVAPSEPDRFEPEEEAVAAGALPRWLAALFIAIPAFAVGYALFLPNGPNCGDAGSLAIDPVTGVAVNCDGSEYGSEDVDLFALGNEIYNGIGCVACHGTDGAGVANFPAFTGGELLMTFPQDSCSAQIEWITLGTTGWPEPTYGATNKPVGGSGAVMPGFEGTLTLDEIAAVSVYERVAFGGQDLDAALADCSSGGAGDTTALGE